MEKRYFIYISITVICIISLIIGVYTQFFEESSQMDTLFYSSSEAYKKTQKEESLKSDFNSLFNNTLNYIGEKLEIQTNKIDANKEIVCTNRQIVKTEKGKYDINANIPVININNQIIMDIDLEIENTFLPKINSLLLDNSNKKEYCIYNVDYVSYINENILSLVIRATLKEGESVQRVMMKTYNYDIKQNKIVTLDDLLQLKQVKTSTIQNKINKEIEETIKKTEGLKQVGYNLYSRDITNDMYKIENTENFFLGNEGYVYILYAYGNENYTSEVDVIVF